MRCCYCNCQLVLPKSGQTTPFPDNMRTRDHIIPKILGGKTTYDNLVISCYKCNMEKGRLLHSEYQAVLAYRKYGDYSLLRHLRLEAAVYAQSLRSLVIATLILIVARFHRQIF